MDYGPLRDEEKARQLDKEIAVREDSIHWADTPKSAYEWVNIGWGLGYWKLKSKKKA